MQENGRQRAAKIDRLYYAAFDRFLYRKRWMGFFGLVVGLAYSAWMFTSTGASHVTTGDLSKPHFAWNQSGCEQCHLPNVPIRKDAWLGSEPSNIALNNQKCNGQCHAVTGHFEQQTKREIVARESCNTCHREHLGFDRSLVEVADTDCARCHANLASVALQPKRKKPVTSFSKEGHPEFAALITDSGTEAKDPGTIRFSHVQHMRPGQPKAKGGTDAKQPQLIEEKYRDRYNRITDKNLIQLICSDCHSRDVELNGYESLEWRAEDATNIASLAVQSTSHKLYKPVEFEKHCVACHELDGVPHGLNLDQTKQTINRLLPLKLLEYLKDRNPNLEPDALTQKAMSEESQEEIEGHEKRLNALLSDSSACLKCHQKAKDAESIVAPSNLKRKWFQNASFTHGSHLMVRCQECHAAPYTQSGDVFDSSIAGNTKSSDEASQVMIPKIEICQKCHIQDPKKRSEWFGSESSGKEKRVASADCVDCHRYHIDSPNKSVNPSLSMDAWHKFFASESLQ